MENMYRDEAKIIQCLQDAGCDGQTIDSFIQLKFKKDTRTQQVKAQLCLLATFRCKLLQDIHTHQKQLDCLDYLVYKLKAADCNCNLTKVDKNDE